MAGLQSFDRPVHGSSGFTCPHCQVWSHQQFLQPSISYLDAQRKPVNEGMNEIQVSRCVRCSRYAFWVKTDMVYPLDSTAPPPTADMPDDVKADYVEARDVVARSPRAAAALLRLAVQRLMPHLGESGKNLNEDIGSMVKKGLPVELQQALDIVRVVGNNAVHPGQIDLNDNRGTADALFEYLNIIVERVITQPKRIQATFGSLPQSALAAIQKRDANP